MGDYNQPPDIIRHLGSLAERLAALERINSGAAWVPLVLTSPWVAAGGFAVPSYYIDNQSRVYLRGEVSPGGSTSNPICVVPAIIRPPNAFQFFSTNGVTTAAVQLDADGTLHPVSTPTSQAFTLDSVQYRLI